MLIKQSFYAAFVLHLVICQRKSDIGLDQTGMIKKNGYPVESHEVQTVDGYIITMYHIPFGIKNAKFIRKPVFIMHGLAHTSSSFVLSDPSTSLAFILADKGYDVWLGNSRGNTLSNKHITIDRKQNPRAFYNFSWHEIGVYDLPACIDYILKYTRADNLHYVGYSQGSTCFYVMASSRPEYNKKIRIASLMAPPAFMSELQEPDVSTTIFSTILHFVTGSLRMHHFPAFKKFRHLLKALCEKEKYEETCLTLYNAAVAIEGHEGHEHLNKSLLPALFTHSPSDGSLRQYLHYFQLMKSGYFRQYDHGWKKNLRIYGSAEPPDYNISAIIAPIAVYASMNDKLARVKDVQRMVQLLPNVVNYHVIPHRKFDHGSFLLATDVVPLVYDQMIKLMDKY